MEVLLDYLWVIPAGIYLYYLTRTVWLIRRDWDDYTLLTRTFALLVIPFGWAITDVLWWSSALLWRPHRDGYWKKDKKPNGA